MSTNQEIEAEVWRDSVRKIQREGGGPAFPVSDTSHMRIGTQIEGALITRGMTLRDYFAAHAPAMTDQWYEDSRLQGINWLDANAAWAYTHAAAMLKARES